MLTQEELKETLCYCPDTGVFTWVKSLKGGKAKEGGIAGIPKKSPSGKAYWYVSIKQRLFFAHRVAVLYMTGIHPVGHVDHINGNGIDNRWENLRVVSPLENSKNLRKASNNTSGHTGVYWSKKDQRWIAQIKINRKVIYLGSYVDINDAITARKTAEIKNGFHANHGTNRPL